MFAILHRDMRNYLAIGIICIPLFFFNVKSWTDWGDDFAQYLHQANNLLSGLPPNETGYIFNEDYPTYAPPSYPSGFPLLLAPVMKLSGANIYTLNLYISFFLSLFAITLFSFLRRYYSDLISVILVILFLYNPWTLSFKSEILSDIPFSLFFLLTIILFTSVRKRNVLFVILFSVICAFTILIRSIGIVLILAIILQSAIEYIKQRRVKNRQIIKSVVSNLLIAFISFLLFFVFSKLIFQSSGEGLLNYKKLVDFPELKNSIQTNLNYYSGVLRAFFEPWNDQWQFVSIISGSMIFTFIILGMIRKMISHYSYLDSLVIVYFAVILIYPYSNAGFRFLLPLIPLLLLYLVKGIMSVDINIPIHRKYVLILLTLIVLFSYKKGIMEIYNSRNVMTEGPQIPANKEMIKYITDSIDSDARFSFKRPRTLAFFTGRKSMTHHRDASPEEIQKNIISNRINYLLINYEEYNQNILDYIKVNESKLEIIWENSKNRIYRIKKEYRVVNAPSTLF